MSSLPSRKLFHSMFLCLKKKFLYLFYILRSIRLTVLFFQLSGPFPLQSKGKATPCRDEQARETNQIFLISEFFAAVKKKFTTKNFSILKKSHFVLFLGLSLEFSNPRVHNSKFAKNSPSKKSTEKKWGICFLIKKKKLREN